MTQQTAQIPNQTTAADTKSGGLDFIFRPKSIAVLGVTNTPGTVPHDIFVNLLDSRFNGVVYPVAPRKKHIAGVRAYDYVLDISDPVDLAILVFPGAICEIALKQCIEKGIKAAIIISAGFREVGAEGAAREERIKAMAAEGGLRLIGPNCLGVINTDPNVQLNASFARAMPACGRIAFLSQSGALCTAVLDYAAGKNIGFSKFVSLGNKADVGEVDLLRYLAEDPPTSVILIYLEEISRGRELMSSARKIAGNRENPKPILAIKSGRTAAGAAAAQSHTGALAASAEICDGVFEQSGIIRCKSIEEMFNTAQLLAYQPLPRGNRISIVTNAGGPGVMATDAAVSLGLELAGFSDQTTAKLKKALPAAANIKNPIDLIGDARADRYMAALEAVFADESVDQILVILTPQSMTNINSIAETICDTKNRFSDKNKTLVCSFMGSKDVAPGISILQQHGIPHYILPEWAAEAMWDAAWYHRWLNREKTEIKEFVVDLELARVVIDNAADGYLLESEALEVLSAYGFPVVEWELTQSADEAVEAAERIGYPVVLRVVSPKIVHKFELKGVVLNLQSEEEVRQAYATMWDNLLKRYQPEDISGIIVRQMIPSGKEMILGISRDPVFGHVLMCGLGGIYVEAIKDVTFRIVPIREAAAGKMVRELRTYSVLKGLRGEPPSDIAAIEDALRRLSQLANDFPRIAEMDINPLIVHSAGQGCDVADIRIRLEKC
ncbi:MAG: acetate--CoA ligase family protein [Planctomycetota bacterium]|nr:MAG: acetate--CoA ligase family protein [Planctomycetota bacterium]